METLEVPTVVQRISSHQGDVLCCCFSGRLLAVGSADKLVRLFAFETAGKKGFGELAQSPLCAHAYAVNCVQFSPLGTLLATCSQDGRAIIWDVRTGRKMGEVEHESRTSLRVCQFSPDARILATGSDDDSAVLWDASSRKILRALEGHESSVVALAFSPDGSYLCTGTCVGDLRFWDARFGHGRHLALVKEAHDLGVTCSQFSPTFGVKGHRSEVGGPSTYLLATGGTDNMVKLWRVSVRVPGNVDEVTISEYTVLAGHTQNVMSVAFSPAGNLLASASGDKTVILWDPIKGSRLHQLSNHNRYVTCCAFSSDGSLLATGSNDKTVAIWKLYGPNEAVEKLGPKEGAKGGSEGNGWNTARAVSSWNRDDVGFWLDRIELPQYKAKFAENLIDGQELIHLNDAMLKNSLSIDALGHRNRIMRAVKALRDGYNLGMGGTGLQSDLPHEYYCPITHEVMSDPAIAADGYTYERSAIAAWIESGKRSSPMTNAPLIHMELTPNRMLKMLIQKNVRV